MESRILYLDIETKCSASIRNTTVYKYVEMPAFDILLLGYSFNQEPVRVIDLASGEQMPAEVISALADTAIIKIAHNATFERICLSKWLQKNGHADLVGYGDEDDSTRNYLNPEGWCCSMIMSSYLGYPRSLDNAGEALNLVTKKMEEGKALIDFFSMPKRNAKVVCFNSPASDADKWELFKEYNKVDVETEIALVNKLNEFPCPESIWKEYRHDQEINDRGIRVNMELVDKLLSLDSSATASLTEKFQVETGIDNPRSVKQVKEWLATKGMTVDSLNKDNMPVLMEQATPEIKEMLLGRQALAKSSVAKLGKISTDICADGRIRGMFQFYGAKTGRWAGRRVQLQNLPRTELKNVDEVRESILSDCLDEESGMTNEEIREAVKQLIRTVFIPAEGKKFIVADFSAIEARVLAWLAGEEWRINAFAEGKDIYCESASKIYGVPVVKNGENGHLRKKGKVAELALGYQGSVGAIERFDRSGELNEEEKLSLVQMWRNANPHIVRFWYDLEKAAKTAIEKRIIVRVRSIKIFYERGILFLQLPSGRRLVYPHAMLKKNEKGMIQVCYSNSGKSGKMLGTNTYGGKLTENITQAVARDLLCNSMKTLKDARIVAHVHDELIIEADKETTKEEIFQKMAETPSWANGLILAADGYESEYYRKD